MLASSKMRSDGFGAGDAGCSVCRNVGYSRTGDKPVLWVNLRLNACSDSGSDAHCVWLSARDPVYCLADNDDEVFCCWKGIDRLCAKRVAASWLRGRLLINSQSPIPECVGD